MNPIVNSIAQVVAKMRDPLTPDGPPYYEFGDLAAISSLLNAKDNRKQLKYKKYPLVFLLMDTAENHGEGATMAKYDLTVGIAVLTQGKYTPRQRYEMNFPTLYTLYEDFLLRLRQSGLFTWPGDQTRPQHTKVDRPYWGAETATGNVKNKFSDPIDAIEITNLKINQRIKLC